MSISPRCSSIRICMNMTPSPIFYLIAILALELGTSFSKSSDDVVSTRSFALVFFEATFANLVEMVILRVSINSIYKSDIEILEGVISKYCYSVFPRVNILLQETLIEVHLPQIIYCSSYTLNILLTSPSF